MAVSAVLIACSVVDGCLRTSGACTVVCKDICGAQCTGGVGWLKIA
jgi:hypothetical protein